MARIKEKIEDFGEKIGGARKDYYSKNGISVEDLEELNHRQLIENTIKAHVFRKPDYEKLVNDGVSKEIAYLIKRAYDSFPTKFEASSDFEEDKLKATNYIKLGKICEDIFSNIKTIEDFEKVKKSLTENNYIYPKSSYYYRLGENAKGIDITNFFKKSNVTRSDIRQAQIKVEESNFPYKMEGWRKGYVIKESSSRICICKKINNRYSIVEEGFKSKEEAEKYLIEVIKPQVEKERSSKKNEIEVRPQLKHIRRVGQSYRDNQDINSDQFMNTFGFRGGEFGNWNTQSDRQQNLNLAYDSLIDLASVIKVSPNAVSLGNTLAIAFGSRGTGGKRSAAAHYEPGAVVINLTKLRGAGSLAHEWGHGLDDYLSRLSGNAKLDHYMSDGITVSNSKIPETAKKFNELTHQLKEKVLDANEIQQKYENKIKEYQDKLKNDLLDRVHKRYKVEPDKYTDLLSLDGTLRAKAFENFKIELDKSYVGFTDYYKTIFQKCDFGIQECQEKIKMKESLVGKEIGETDFYKYAKILDENRSKGYWANNKELFARAFESYIEYKLKDSNRQSDYLVYGTGFAPLYVGNKREQGLIFSKFEELFEVMKELDKSNLINDNYKIIDDTYENKDYKEKDEVSQVEELSDEEPMADIKADPLDIINNSKEFRFATDNQVNIAVTNRHSDFVDIVKFNEDGKLLSVEFDVEKEGIKKLVSSKGLTVVENSEDKLKVISDEILQNKDFTNVVNEVDNLLINSSEGVILSEKYGNESEKFHVALYDTSLRLVDTMTFHSPDELKSLMLKSSIISVSETPESFMHQHTKDFLEFKVVQEQINKFKSDQCFEVEFKDKICEVDFIEKDNLYKVKNITTNGNLEYFKEYELINKFIEDKPIELRENYIKKIEREMAEETDRANKILEELKTADAFTFKNDELNKHIIVTPSTRESGMYQITYLHNNEPLSHGTVDSLEAVSLRLAEEGLCSADIKEKIKLEQLKVEGIKDVNDIPIPTGNIGLNDLKAKGAIQVIRLNNNNIERLKNLNQDFCSFKNQDYTSVIVLKSEATKALEALGFRNQEISKIPYNTFKTLPGKNQYILMTKEEFEKFKTIDTNYSAFIKNDGINVVVKESDLKNTLQSIGRNSDKTLGNTVYGQLKENGDVEHRKYDTKTGLKIMGELLEKNIKFDAFYKGDSNVAIAFNKEHIDKFNNIVEKVKLETNKAKQVER